MFNDLTHWQNPSKYPLYKLIVTCDTKLAIRRPDGVPNNLCQDLTSDAIPTAAKGSSRSGKRRTSDSLDGFSPKNWWSVSFAWSPFLGQTESVFFKYGVCVLSWLVRCGEIKLALSWFERFILRTDSVNWMHDFIAYMFIHEIRLHTLSKTNNLRLKING